MRQQPSSMGGEKCLALPELNCSLGAIGREISYSNQAATEKNVTIKINELPPAPRT